MFTLSNVKYKSTEQSDTLIPPRPAASHNYLNANRTEDEYSRKMIRPTRTRSWNIPDPIWTNVKNVKNDRCCEKLAGLFEASMESYF